MLSLRQHNNGHRSIAASWQDFSSNIHVKTEFAALLLAMVAFGASLIGLHITPIVCGAIAIILVLCDIFDWTQERRSR